MLSSLKTTLALVVTLFICLQPANGQQIDTSKTEADAELREKAFTALQSLADQLSSLQSPENRARIGANIADSLWRRDESRARSLFQLANEDIKLGLQTSPRHPRTKDLTFQVFLKLREDTLRRVAKYDGEFALALFREVSPVVKESGSLPSHHIDRLEMTERALEVELSRFLARQNPGAALGVARKTLAGGFDEGLVSLLLQLNDKHKEDARSLYREIVSKVVDTDLRVNERAYYFSSRLAQSFPPPAADQSSFRNLLDSLLTAALASGCASDEVYSQVCYALGPLVSQMEQFFPTRAARLKRWADPEHYGRSNSPPEAQFQLNQARESGTIEDMIALAAKFPAMEGEILTQAMRKAESAGDFESAQKIADDYRGNPDISQRLKQRTEIYALEAAKLEAIFARVQEQTAELPLEQQVRSLLAFANHAAPSARESALKALVLAKPKVESLKPGPEQIRNQMMLAAIYCMVQSDQGFVVLEGMLPGLNELISASARLDGFDTHYLRDGEWNMSANGEVGKLLTFLSNNADHFAWYDFQRAMNLAAQFERTEIRMMAQLKLAQGILAGRRKRLGRESPY